MTIENSFLKRLQNLLLLLLPVVIFSCQTGEKGDKKSAGVAEEPAVVEWVSYTPANSSNMKKVVLISGDEEYRSEEALPQLARILSTRHGFECTVLFAQNPEFPGRIDPNYLNNIPGLQALDDADLMIIFTRFRDLPGEQMQHIDDYLRQGKPVLGIRTATHAFNVKDSTSAWQQYGNYYEGEMDEWKDGFGRLVMGEHWFSHHGHHKHQSTRGIIAPGAEQSPITNGIEDGNIWGSTDVYGVRLPLPGNSNPIILGQVIDRSLPFDEHDIFYGLREKDEKIATKNKASKTDYNPNEPMMPIAWTKSYQIPGGISGEAFASTIGSSSDLLNEGVRRLLVNAAYYLVGLDVPASAEVDLVGDYKPSAYGFRTEANYWADKNLYVKEFLVP